MRNLKFKATRVRVKNKIRINKIILMKKALEISTTMKMKNLQKKITIIRKMIKIMINNQTNKIQINLKTQTQIQIII